MAEKSRTGMDGRILRHCESFSLSGEQRNVGARIVDLAGAGVLRLSSEAPPSQPVPVLALYGAISPLASSRDTVAALRRCEIFA